MLPEELYTTLNGLLDNGRGILDVDESPRELQRYFESVALINSPDTCRDYRSMLVTTPGIEHFISGIILDPETLNQRTREGVPLVEVIDTQGMIVGVKVYRDNEKLPLSQGEKLSQGLYGLRERLQVYREKGAHFAKWRAVFSIGPGTPSDYCIAANAHQLACFAAFCQEEILVPIVEVELLNDGDHDLKRCEQETVRILQHLFTVLQEYGIALEGMLLKTHILTPGRQCNLPSTAEQAAQATNRCLDQSVPQQLPGVLFHCSGLSPEDATEYLSAIVAEKVGPWTLSFNFGSALQEPALRVWRGRTTQIEPAQQALYRRAEFNAAAIRGGYNSQLERIA